MNQPEGNLTLASSFRLRMEGKHIEVVSQLKTKQKTNRNGKQTEKQTKTEKNNCHPNTISFLSRIKYKPLRLKIPFLAHVW